MKGIFISIEGTDGSGKTTQINLLREYFEEKGYDVVITREPGGTKIGEDIRNIILDNKNEEMSHITEAFLYAASRAQHVNELIVPALRDGKVVISDRYVHSSIVYQGHSRGLGMDFVRDLNNLAIGDVLPNITFYLELSPERGIARKKDQKKLDRLEKEKLEFHQKVYEGYKILKDNNTNIKTIDASKTVEDIHSDIVEQLEILGL